MGKGVIKVDISLISSLLMLPSSYQQKRVYIASEGQHTFLVVEVESEELPETEGERLILPCYTTKVDEDGRRWVSLEKVI